MDFHSLTMGSSQSPAVDLDIKSYFVPCYHKSTFRRTRSVYLLLAWVSMMFG